MADTQKIIVASFFCPPAPTRNHDWCAYRESKVESGQYGWGATEEDAVEDLLRSEREEYSDD